MAKDTDLALLAQLLTVDSNSNVTLAANQFTSSSTNTFTVGTSAYFVANGNLGVGNNAPTEKIQVQGNIQLQNGASTANTSRNAGIRFWTDNAFGAELHYGDTGSGLSTGYATAVYGRKSDTVAVRIGAYPGSNTSQNTFSEYVTVLNSGNVGIGNTAPNAKLQVTGTANVSGNVIIASALTSANLTTTTNVATIGTAAYFVSNGNVGIGTSSPLQRVDIRGGNGTGGITGPSSGTWAATITMNQDANTYNGLAVSNRWASDTSTILDAGMGWNGVAAGYYSVFTIDGLGQAIFKPQRTEAMRINSSGNVGIGTSSPGERFSVSGGNLRVDGNTASTFTGFINRNNGASASNYRGLFYDATNENGIPVANMLVDVQTDGSSSWSWSTTPAGSRTSDRRIERMRIDSSGNVGIATSTPGAKLEVYGGTANDAAAEFRVSGNGYIDFHNALSAGSYNSIVSSGDKGIIFTNGTPDTGNFVIAPWASVTSGFRMIANGNVGIGTPSPNATLAVSGTANVSGNVVIGGIATITGNLIASSTSGINANNLLLQGDGTNAYIRPTNSGSILYLGANNNNLVTVAANGNVGIGNSSPGYKLDVNGYVGSTRYNLTSTNSTYAYGDGSGWAFTGSGYVYLNQAGSTYAQTRIISRAGISDDTNAALTLYGGTGGYTQINGSARSPVFYDSDDTNSYFEGPQLFMRGGAPTVYFRDTDHNSAMIHCNSNLLYILRGGNDTTSWTQVNSQWPCYFNLTNNDAVLGGAFYAVGNITAYYSDRRLKTDIKHITNAIDKLKQINGVYYKNNDFAKSVGYTDEDEQVGVISQEVEKVLPHVVKRAPFDIEYDETDRTKIKSKSGEDYKTVQYDRLVPLLIEAIKEQQVEIEKLKAAIAKEV